DGKQMDEILTDLQKDNIDIKGVKSGTFFELLLDSTLSGAYSDPIYNGNIGMEGWKMKNFPGNQMSYIKEIEEEFTKMEPRSEEHTSELQSRFDLVCRLLLEKKKKK